MTAILFDARSLDAGPSGAKTRLLRLAPELVRRGHAVSVAVAEGFDPGPALPGVRLIPAGGVPGPVMRRLRPRALAAAVRASGAAVLVFETWPAPLVDLPAIAVVHDLRHVRAGGWRRLLATSWLRDAARRVRRFQAVSEATREELLLVLPEAVGRVDVVPNAVCPQPDGHPEPLPAGVAGPYVLAVGHAETRKAWSIVAEVAAAIRGHGLTVVRAGRGSVPAPNVIDLGVVSDRARDALFRCAVAVLAPASIEGFGLVPLEALGCGAWVVASDIPAHREVCGGAADYFEPGDRDGAVARILAAARATAGDRGRRDEQACAQARAFSPARAADAFEASLRAARVS